MWRNTLWLRVGFCTIPLKFAAYGHLGGVDSPNETDRLANQSILVESKIHGCDWSNEGAKVPEWADCGWFEMTAETKTECQGDGVKWSKFGCRSPF